MRGLMFAARERIRLPITHPPATSPPHAGSGTHVTRPDTTHDDAGSARRSQGPSAMPESERASYCITVGTIRPHALTRAGLERRAVRQRAETSSAHTNKTKTDRAVTTASIARDGHEQAGHLVVEVAVARDTLHPQRRLRARCLDGGRRAWARLALDEQQQRLG